MLRRKARRSALTAAAAALLTGGCFTAERAAGDWMLTSLDGQPPLDGIAILLHADARSVRGTDGCNSFRATMRGPANAGILSGFETTLRACTDRVVQDQASRVAAVLASSPRYEIVGDTLTVSGTNGVLRFTRSATAP